MDDRVLMIVRVFSGIIFVNRNGLRWREAPKEYGPSKTLYNRWKRWGEKGVFIAMMDAKGKVVREVKVASEWPLVF